MPDMHDVNKISADLIEVTVGADKAPFEASVRFRVGHDTHRVRSARMGSDIIKSIVQGRMGEGEIVFLQTDQDTVQRVLQAAASTPREMLAPGATLPTVAIVLHDPAAADATGDITFYAVTFGEIDRDADGLEEGRIRVPFTAQRDASGRLARIGAAA